MIIIKKIIVLSLLVSIQAFSETKIELFGVYEDGFIKGKLVQEAINNGTRVVFYKQGLRKELEAKLSKGLSNDPDSLIELDNRMKLNPEFMDELIQAKLGEKRVSEFNIKIFPAVLIDGNVFYTADVELALESLK